MHMNEEMRAARWQLQELSVSDPAAMSNMLRHLAALTIMVTGRRDDRRCELEPVFEAGFQLTAGEQRLCMHMTGRTGVEQVYMAFDVDDAAGPPCGLAVVRREREVVTMACKCMLWSPSANGKALIVPTGEGAFGHFAFRPGRPLRHVATPPPGDLAAGLARGAARQTRLAESRWLREAHRGGIRTIYHNEGSEVVAHVTALAS